MRGKTYVDRAGSLLLRPVLSILMVLMLIAAVVPAYAGDTAIILSNSSVSTYIVVFNDTAQAKSVSIQSVSSLVESYGGNIKYRYSIINGMAVTIPDNLAENLHYLPNVKYVEKDEPVYALLDQAAPQIGADQDWAEGYTGQGVKVAVVDTGVDASHPDLNSNKVIAWADFVKGQNSTPYDDNGHGTHVCGIISSTGNASNGKYRGVAPNSSLIVAKVLSGSGSGSTSAVVAGIDWAVQQHAQIISLSLGGSYASTLEDAVNNAVKSGVVVVVAAGNNGPGGNTPISPPNSIACPGDNPNAITVGAVDKLDNLASYSSLGPTTGGLTKPDVVNVGSSVVSDKAGGTAASGYYLSMTGTSMATPMTSGVIALILQKNSSLTPSQVKSILEQTAKPMKVNSTDPIPNNNYGWGRVQARFALDNVTISASSSPKYPKTVWSDMGDNGMVTGQVVASTNLSRGISGAYISVVNASNTSQVYCSGYTDSRGKYYISGINATYSSVLGEGPHGQTGSDYQLGLNAYKIYAYKSSNGSGYSSSFGIDADNTSAIVTSVVLYPPPPNVTNYGPETVWSDIGMNGSITGKVVASTNLTAGVSGAYVALVNASNLSQEYSHTVADSNGKYYIGGVNATYSSVLNEGPHGLTGSDYINGTKMYRIYSNKSSYGSGYSTVFGIDTNVTGSTSTSVVLIVPPANVTKYGPETVWSDQGAGGNATGRVITYMSGSVGIAGAYVALVDAFNVDREYTYVYSDANGNYNFTCLNATYSSALQEGPNGQKGQDYTNGTVMYKLHVDEGIHGEGYSGTFGIDTNQSAPVTTSIVLFTRPARIDLVAERRYIATNGSDNIKITAHVYDALGNAVADGYNINFTVGNSTNNSFMQWGDYTFLNGNYLPAANGSLGSDNNFDNYFAGTTSGNTGSADVQFGWVDKTYRGNNSTIWAYWYDSDDPAVSASINASMKIYYDQQPFTYSLTEGWNLIDVPLIITDTNLTGFFSNGTLSGITDIWGWNESAQNFEYYNPDSNDSYFEIYPHLTNIETGRAYWVKTNMSSSFTIEGLVPDCSPNSTVLLVKKWNFVGPTGFSVSTPQDMFPGAVDIWGWNESAQDFEYYNPDPTDSYFEIYPKITTLRVGYGYWANYPD